MLSLVMLGVMCVLLLLSGTIALKIYRLWRARQRGQAGTKLQTRMVVMFGLVSLVPTLLVAIFSVLFFNLGLQNWFNTKVSTALESSLQAAEGYLTEHKNNIRGDAAAMASDLNRQSPLLKRDPKRLKQIIRTQAIIRELSEAVVFQHEGAVEEEGIFEIPLNSLENRLLDTKVMHHALGGEVAVFSEENNRVRALILLSEYSHTYLLIGRMLDENVLAFYAETQGSVNEYQRLKGNINKLQLQFLLIFLAVALLLLLATIWAGLRFAGRLTRPISNLVEATQALKEGKLDVRAEDIGQDDEMGTLTRAFNRMAEELQHNQASLVQQKDFMAQLLAEISTGVLVVDAAGNITVSNAAAKGILHQEALEGQELKTAWPAWKQVEEGAMPSLQQIKWVRDKQQRTVLVHQVQLALQSTLITLDDITELQVAERNAAWSDVARRVAHEIKNPLTPMQLSAERLAKKYGSDLQAAEKEKFSQYTGTILRHIETVRHIVDAFAYFAKLPAPELKQLDIVPAIKAAVISEQVAHADISYHLPEQESCMILADAQQLKQLLQNLLKNAAESMQSLQEKAIFITLEPQEDGMVELSVRDAGPGFSEAILQEGITPYRTEKAEGTGLGLAIVEKITKEHGGQIELQNHADGGAIVRCSFRC